MTSEALKALDIIESDYDLLSGNWTPDPRPMLATIRVALSDISPAANSESWSVSEPVQKKHKLDHIAGVGKMVSILRQLGYTVTPPEGEVSFPMLIADPSPVVSPHSKGVFPKADGGAARELGVGWRLSEGSAAEIARAARQNVNNASRVGNRIMRSALPTQAEVGLEWHPKERLGNYGYRELKFGGFVVGSYRKTTGTIDQSFEDQAHVMAGRNCKGDFLRQKFFSWATEADLEGQIETASLQWLSGAK